MTGARILLVEDDEALAELLTWHLRREGHHVEHTTDGEEALLLGPRDRPISCCSIG
jgi:two-component system phosphate regulon response regulator PhoB